MSIFLTVQIAVLISMTIAQLTVACLFIIAELRSDRYSYLDARAYQAYDVDAQVEQNKSILNI